jgi:hypothetical protein
LADIGSAGQGDEEQYPQPSGVACRRQLARNLGWETLNQFTRPIDAVANMIESI